MEMSRFSIWAPPPFDKDSLFETSGPLNRDNCLAPFRKLKKSLEARGCQCHTYDIFQCSSREPEIVLFLDIPTPPLARLLGDTTARIRKWVFLQECEVVLPRNWDKSRHLEFERIFTWNDKLIDQHKYIKLNFSNDFPTLPVLNKNNKTGLCTLIARNKSSHHPLELYSKRIETARWFEIHHPEDFSLYGLGWDEFRFTGKANPLRALNRIKTVRRWLAPRFPSYKGVTETKASILGQFKFCICYENARDIPGYITEKIFDCFFSSCVPVYWGANNIEDHIPATCFIDRRHFSSHEELYRFLTSMSDHTYQDYLNAARSFLNSAKSHPFSAEYFTETILKEVFDER